MNNERNVLSTTDEGILIEESRISGRQQSRGTKRMAPTTPGSIRKQFASTGSIAPPPLSVRGTASAAVVSSAARANEDVTYRLVQIATPSESGQHIVHQQNINQKVTGQLIATNTQAELLESSEQQILLNPSGGLTFSSTTMHTDASTPSRLTYVPASTISVASPGTVGQTIQLQQIESTGGQYYIMLPTGTELTAGSVSSIAASTTPARIVATPRLQRAAFIPLSRLEPAQSTFTTVPTASATANAVKRLDFHSNEPPPHTKEVKRRVSHNEVEKRRRDKINNWIEKLAQIVPNCANEYSATKSAQSKGGVLALVFDYIQDLRDTKEHLIDFLRRYEAVATTLTEENNQLRDMLHRAGIEPPVQIYHDLPNFNDFLSAKESFSQHSPSPPPASTPVTTAAPIGRGSNGGPVCTSQAVTHSPSQFVLVQTDKGPVSVRLMQNGGKADNESDEHHDSRRESGNTVDLEEHPDDQ